MRRLALFLFLLGIMSMPVLAVDLLVLNDGTILTGEILLYENDGLVRFKNLKGSITEYTSKQIRASRTNLDAQTTLLQTLDPTYNMIIYLPREKQKAYEIPPRYRFRGQSYRMETQWGRETEVLEFLSLLQEQELDEQTSRLIHELQAAMGRQTQKMNTALITQLAGISMMLVPFFVSNDSEGTTTFPTWSLYVGTAGVALDVISIAMLIKQLFVDHDHYLEKIAQSYNAAKLN